MKLNSAHVWYRANTFPAETMEGRDKLKTLTVGPRLRHTVDFASNACAAAFVVVVALLMGASV